MGRILLITAGATPQVVTETVWALAHQQAWLPDRILLATTGEGARLYERGDPDRGIDPLLGPSGRLARLLDVLGATSTEIAVRVARKGDEVVADLRTKAEVELFADMLLAEVAAITAAPATELHLSLAGGRKTMSFIAGQVMSLLGRRQDVLSHVLVEPRALENRPDFWWPGDGAPISEAAQVLLHAVPFLRVRAWVEPERVFRNSREPQFTDAVGLANLAFSDLEIRLDLGAKELRIGPFGVDLAPTEAALLALVFVARRRGVALTQVSGWNPQDPKRNALALDGCRKHATWLWAWLRAAVDLESIYRDHLVVSPAPFDRRCSELADRIDYQTQIAPLVSRLRDKLRNCLTPLLAEQLLPSLRLELATLAAPEAIRILCPADLAAHPDRPAELEVPAA
ncbi:MAG: CRISPR-associated ring nuclease Csm6, partial [Sphingomonadaceae bacterium]